MAWDFETDPEFQKKLDWIEAFMRDEVEPLSHLGMAVYSSVGREKFIKPLQQKVKDQGLWACHLGPELGGQGYGQEGLDLLLRYGFDELGLHRVQTYVGSYNTGAARFLERNGFLIEVRRRQAVARDGQRWDILLYALLRAEEVEFGVGGFDRTYVCVAGADGVANALRFTRAGGVVTLLGNVTTLPGLDWSPVWLKELAIRGSLAYGHHAGAGTDAFREALDLIAAGRANVGALVTHVFPLAEVGKALAAASGKKGSGSIKVALRP